MSSDHFWIAAKVPPDAYEKIVDLILKSPQRRIKIKQISAEYESAYKSTLDYRGMGFPKIKDFIEALREHGVSIESQDGATEYIVLRQRSEHPNKDTPPQRQACPWERTPPEAPPLQVSHTPGQEPQAAFLSCEPILRGSGGNAKAWPKLANAQGSTREERPRNSSATQPLQQMPKAPMPKKGRGEKVNNKNLFDMGSRSAHSSQTPDRRSGGKFEDTPAAVEVDMKEVNKRVKKIRLELHSGTNPVQVRLTVVQQKLCDAYGVSALKHLRALVEHDDKKCYPRNLDTNMVDELRIISKLEDKVSI